MKGRTGICCGRVDGRWCRFLPWEGRGMALPIRASRRLCQPAVKGLKWARFAFRFGRDEALLAQLRLV